MGKSKGERVPSYIADLAEGRAKKRGITKIDAYRDMGVVVKAACPDFDEADLGDIFDIRQKKKKKNGILFKI